MRQLPSDGLSIRICWIQMSGSFLKWKSPRIPFQLLWVCSEYAWEPPNGSRLFVLSILILILFLPVLSSESIIYIYVAWIHCSGFLEMFR